MIRASSGATTDASRRVRSRSPSRRASGAGPVIDALVHQQDVERGQHDAERRDDRGRRVARERADQHQELADEAGQARQRQADRPATRNDAGQQRRDLLHAAEVGDLPRAAAADQDSRR